MIVKINNLIIENDVRSEQLLCKLYRANNLDFGFLLLKISVCQFPTIIPDQPMVLGPSNGLQDNILS
ncbi:unnamed protein product [Rhodiola kirilowii]